MKIKYPVFWGTLAVAFAAFVLLVISGNIMWFSTERPLQVIADMDNQFKVKPQTGSSFFADRKSNRDPIANTMPRSGGVYEYAMGDVDKAEAKYASGNPLQRTDYVLARGQNRFNTFCAPCHNYSGTGDGLVQKRGMGSEQTMNLMRPEARVYTDAKIFHIISAGQNIMPAYGDRLQVEDRWAVLHYLRSLQERAAKAEGVPMPTPIAVEPTPVAPAAAPAAATTTATTTK
ncbi:MAG: cytochrome c [Candidatus Kapabacteria bacterium]|nr:cytochrome c [Candidatus Kapabacteria bacterium]